MNFPKKFYLLFFLVLIGPTSTTNADIADPRFENLPAGCFVVKSFTVPQGQLAEIEKNLGAPISKLSNTQLTIHGSPIQVNIIDAKTEIGAKRIHEIIAKMKADPAFCLREGKRVIEYVAPDAALATKTSYELGFIPKPTHVRYRITANIAPVDRADYMVLNNLFNLLLKTEQNTSPKNLTSQISSLSKRLAYGNKITLRMIAGEKIPTYTFSPAPEQVQSAPNNESATYTFPTPLRKSHGIPYVTLTAEIQTINNPVTPTKRKGDSSLVASTAFWPVDDPDIKALAGKITAGKNSTEAKVEAILKWLSPGVNIKFGGPIIGSRYGVKKVLQQGYGQCWDFADCFITLCRAAGVPCRQVGGWLYGTSGHIWAEVLLEGKGWKQVDPTGGGKLTCGIYHIPYFVTEDGNMPILYTAMPEIEIIEAN